MLMEFLVDEECEGFGDGDYGIEIGHSSINGVSLRGAFAKESFAAGDFLCAIPFPTTLVIQENETESTTDAERGLVFLKKYVENRNVEFSNNKWAPYLDCIGDGVGNCNCFTPTPDFFSEEEIKLLEFPRLVNASMKRKLGIQNLAEKEGIEVDHLQFATWLVKTRSFSIIKVNPEEGKMRTKSVLIPFLDMINHSSDNPNAELQVVEAKGEDESFYALRATRSIPANKEITIAYGTGKDSSVDLYLNYGFVPKTNPCDVELLRDKQGEDCFIRADQWSTSLEQDEHQSTTSEGSMLSILEFRSRMKRALKEVTYGS
jgi:hypothetical protein